ncbi:hypothetical protein [Thermocatellispora tengchongensis]|uniref:hypothetical protein n=1 Tax=Thermocatellispora tengchongensis TaxID=1073253 RepID=UPI00363166DF
MLDAMIVPLLVTTDLPPGSDVAQFGRIVTGAVRTLRRGDLAYPGYLHGRTFWLDRPGPPGGLRREELRFAALLGFLSAAGPRGSAREVVADARAAITVAISARYGDLGSPPAVMGIRSEDVRERTPRPPSPRSPPTRCPSSPR